MSTLVIDEIDFNGRRKSVANIIRGSNAAMGTSTDAGVANYSGTMNVSSITDQGTGGADYAINSAFDTTPLIIAGKVVRGEFNNASGFIWTTTAGITTSNVGVRYYNGTAYEDSFTSFSATAEVA